MQALEREITNLPPTLAQRLPVNHFSFDPLPSTPNVLRCHNCMSFLCLLSPLVCVLSCLLLVISVLFFLPPPTARGRWPPSLILVLLELFLSTVAKCLLISRFCHFCSLHCKVPWDDYCCDSVKHKLQNSRTTFWLYGHWEMRRISTAAHCRNKVFKSQ